ncbi:hypothetical protein B0H19DRAFT_1064266 [Mycena capillaripes]|nr:hypothetical protein B0H19DRAFT_1064266 [Mycena capillaripes]
MLYSLFLLSPFVTHALAFSLTGPDTAQSGEPIEFTWTLDDGDPLSFGLMQRSLAGNAPILEIDGVENSAGATTGTASVIFGTTGYDPATPPNQLAAGKQLTITENTSPGGVVPPPAPLPPTAPTTSTTTSILNFPPSTTTFTTTTATTTFSIAISSISALSDHGNQASSRFLSTTFAAGLVNPKPKQTTASDTQIKISSLSDFTGSYVEFKTRPHALSSSPTPPTQPFASTSTPSAQRASKGGSNKHAIIAAVVTAAFMVLIGGLALFLRQQRSATASRLRRFRLRMKHLHSPGALDGMSLISGTSTPLWGPARDITANNPSADSDLVAGRADRLSVPVVSDKQHVLDNSGDVLGTGIGAGRTMTGRIPLTPPPSYDEHGVSRNE